MLGERLRLDGGISPSNLRVHLEVDHRSGNWWQGRAAILRGQEFKRRRKLWSEVMDLIVWARRGAMVKTHVSTSLVMSAEVSSFERPRRFRGREETRRYLGMYDIRVSRPLPVDGGG